jgi:hypothetical protein
MGVRALLIPIARTLPLPTIDLEVSGRKRSITSKQQGEIIDKNQKMAFHPQ